MLAEVLRRPYDMVFLFMNRESNCVSTAETSPPNVPIILSKTSSGLSKLIQLIKAISILVLEQS
jgi:hypothetical protein